jgi:hypothetical protein
MASAPVRHFLDVRYYNTLHGFQYLGSSEDDGSKWFVACLYSIPRVPRDGTWYGEEADGYTQTELLPKMLEKAGFWVRNGDEDPPRDRAILDDFIGHPYVAVKHKRDAPACINALLSLGCKLTVQTKLRAFYEPKDAPYSLETSERLAIKGIRELLSSGRTPTKVGHWIGGSVIPDIVLYEHLWKSEEGKKFARDAISQEPWLAQRIDEPLFLRDDPRQPFDQSIDWPPVIEEAPPIIPSAALKPAAALPPRKRAPVNKKGQEDTDMESWSAWIEEPVTCIVCMEKPADTLVLPCNHQVACRACSDRLKSTPNAHKCILCRQSITSVVTDG